MLISHNQKPKLFFGKYRAFARDIHDPERLGRIRLEIPTVLGIGQEHWINWAWPCFPYGGSQDTGMFLIPNEGSCIWAEFEGGKIQYTIWSGVWYGGSDPGDIPIEATYLCDDASCKDCPEKKEHQANEFQNIEHGRYHGHPPYYCPRVKVLFKSETGHSIIADDRHEKESLKIIDRGGQCISMSSPIKAELQEECPLVRGENNSETENQFDISQDIVDKKASIKLTDLSGQSITLDASKDLENISITSQNKEADKKQEIKLDTTKDNEKISLISINNEQSIIIDSSKGSENITLTDKEKQSIKLDPNSGSIEIQDKEKDKLNLSDNSISLKNKSGSKIEISNREISLKNIDGETIDIKPSTIELKNMMGNKINIGPGLIDISDVAGNSVKMMPGMLSIQSSGILMFG